jgi:hypothetical protein
MNVLRTNYTPVWPRGGLALEFFAEYAPTDLDLWCPHQQENELSLGRLIEHVKCASTCSGRFVLEALATYKKTAASHCSSKTLWKSPDRTAFRT